MRQAARVFFCAVMSFVFLPLFVLAQEPKMPQNTAFKQGDSPSTTGAIFRTFFSLEMWWFWLGILAVVGLLGFLYYQRKKSMEDD